ncbi:spermidine/putrescine transport system permease protein [Butyrivibrio sp. Su6]|nr:ABC transporter permease [Butyrivibrio sp. Su6]SEF42183.1 spermidine/putrescine transport system permease protein [Butyrivibrio sp. Su6]
MKLFKNKNTAPLLSSPYMAWALIFILVPLGMVIYYGFTTEDGFFTFENIATIAKPGYMKALIRSIRLALISTLVCLLLAYPLGMILSSMKLTRNTYIVTLFILPMWMNFLLRTLTWMTLLEGKGVINTVLESLHLPTINIINTPAAIVLGMVYNFLPFMILPIYNSLSKIDENVINAARDLGADSLQTFLKITFPLSLPGVLSGITMVFIPALTTFAISSMLGGSKILLIGNIIEQEFTQLYDWHLGSGLSIVLMIFIFINMIIEALSGNQGGK